MSRGTEHVSSFPAPPPQFHKHVVQTWVVTLEEDYCKEKQVKVYDKWAWTKMLVTVTEPQGARDGSIVIQNQHASFL